jgi:hypothetical protein
MDLPPCPSCGNEMRVESSRGPAKCPTCGFTTPVELDVVALHNLLEDASQRGLGPRAALAPSTEAPEPRLEGRKTPTMLESSRSPDLPQLSPPAPPRELVMGSPPPLKDPKSSVDMGGRETATTPLGASMEEQKEIRKRELKACGELFK